MAIVFVLGAGASIGASPHGKTKFPSVTELMKRIREIVCEEEKSSLPALALYLSRYSPLQTKQVIPTTLNSAWDHINVEELYAAIEFEIRLTDHLMLNSGDKGSGIQLFHEFFSPSYRDAVSQLILGPYADWVSTCYSASYGIMAFPHVHENFLRIVKMELLDSIALSLSVLSEREDTSNLSRLVRSFHEGDTVITFNYDLLIEQHLMKDRPNEWSYLTGYGLAPTSNECDLRFTGEMVTEPSKEPSRFKVLKLHGSCNWHIRYVQGPANGPPGFAEGYRTVPEPIGAGNQVRNVSPAFFQATDNYHKRITLKGEPPGYYERFMIPPSPYKAEYSFSGEFLHMPDGTPLPLASSTMWLPQSLFRQSLNALSNADRIVFIGFSLAPADTSIRMLFRAATDANPRLSILEIADPSSDVTKRIRTLVPNARYETHGSFGELLDSWAV